MAMTLRLDNTHDEMVERLAREMKCSKHQAVINAIEMADLRVGVRDKAIKRAQTILETRDKALMDRLADA
ncbi:MAG: putative transcriptional regulator [Pontimonas sp.]|jgi:predicted transcriptional regulator